MSHEIIASVLMSLVWGLVWESGLKDSAPAKRFKAYADEHRGVRGVLFGLLLYLWLSVAVLALLWIARLMGYN